MTDAKAFVPGKGFVGAPEQAPDAVNAPPFKGADNVNAFEVREYVAEREAAQLAMVAASMDRAFGRKPDLPGRRALGLAGPPRCDNGYDPLRR